MVTRRRLMAAAEERFLSAGFLSTTVDDITAAAGVSRATFYLHFPNKTEILRDLAVSSLPELKELYGRLDLVLAGGGAREDLRHWVADAFRYLEDHERQIAVFAEAVVADNELASQHLMTVLDEVLEAMPRSLAVWPRARHEEARLRLAFLIMQLERIALHLLLSKGYTADRNLVIDLVCEQLVGLLPRGEIEITEASSTWSAYAGRRSRTRRSGQSPA
jgi:AcrR family transcriptional regulator